MNRPETQSVDPPPGGIIMSVNGAVEPADLGFTLVHEHVMSTFGAEPARYPSYDTDRLLKQVLPYLAKLKELGCQTLVDCTAAYFGRHPELLRRISQESGLHILTNTGYYGAANDRYVPPHAYHETAEQIAGRWTREWSESIDGTGIFPGFIKTAVDGGPLSEIDRKLLIAAAITHRQTGLTIQTHTGDNIEAAHSIMSILLAEGVSPQAWIWVHASNVTDVQPLLLAAGKGAWISLDGVSGERAQHILGLMLILKENSYLSHVLLSHDGDAYSGEGEFRPFDYLFTGFIPLLKANGFSEVDIHQLTIQNPRRAFTVKIKR
ncbi:MAG: phosphotriesterase [Chloroflexi bacterium]|nr:phosphotriesterase [Chloroflexota bacterium]